LLPGLLLFTDWISAIVSLEQSPTPDRHLRSKMPAHGLIGAVNDRLGAMLGGTFGCAEQGC
jgi:hypothetical protein